MMKPENLERKKAYKWRMACTKAREDYAAAVLAPDAISAAAAEGFELVAIRIEKPLDLRGTQAAKTLAQVLGQEGLELEWLPRAVMAKDSPNGCDSFAYDVLVRW